jgi:hypothetical protein
MCASASNKRFTYNLELKPAQSSARAHSPRQAVQWLASASYAMLTEHLGWISRTAGT